mmetsp:Transcript_30796/g.52793  ORF Transcript_30796/g.52793 Transcript_30796/m.52793 type:complete len:97 (-) Transcript_30796:34-324(-)
MAARMDMCLVATRAVRSVEHSAVQKVLLKAVAMAAVLVAQMAAQLVALMVAMTAALMGQNSAVVRAGSSVARSVANLDSWMAVLMADTKAEKSGVS